MSKIAIFFFDNKKEARALSGPSDGTRTHDLRFAPAFYHLNYTCFFLHINNICFQRAVFRAYQHTLK